MEIRDKLLAVILKAEEDFSETNKPVLDIYKYVADAIVESGLLKDDKVYKPIKKEDPFTHANNYWCSACETFIGSGIYGATTRYCPKCGKKIKE